MITRQDYKDFPVLMVEFLNYMDAIRNKSKNTISEYASDLRLFFRFLLGFLFRLLRSSRFLFRRL